MFLREQSRVRKFRQLAQDKLAYYEPALKVWAVQDNFFQFIGFPLAHAEPDKLLALETAYQRTYGRQYNWPWVNPLLKRLRIGRQPYGPISLKTTSAGMKFIKKCKKRSLISAQCIHVHSYTKIK